MISTAVVFYVIGCVVLEVFYPDSGWNTMYFGIGFAIVGCLWHISKQLDRIINPNDEQEY